MPLAIVNKAHTANQIYPFAVSLIESVRMYERTCDKVMCLLSPLASHTRTRAQCTHTHLMPFLLPNQQLQSTEKLNIAFAHFVHVQDCYKLSCVLPVFTCFGIG